MRSNNHEIIIQRISSGYSNPAPRYLASASLVGFFGDRVPSKIKYPPLVLDEETKPTFLLFGGDNGLFEDGAILNEMWASPFFGETLDYEEMLLRARQNDICDRLLDPTYTYWNQTCGSNVNQINQLIEGESTTSVCQWKDIIEMALCQQQYQTFTSPV